MATNFPTSQDTFTNPVPADKLNNPPHATQHQNANDAIIAIEAKVGSNSSAVTTSHDYKLGEVTGSDKAAGKTATQTLTNKTVNLTSNTLSGTTAQFNTALSDNDFATLAGSETLTNKTLTTPRVGTSINDTNGNEIIRTPATGSAVNELTITNSATLAPVLVTATGDDTNIDLRGQGKGTGRFFADYLPPQTYAATSFYDHVVSGGVWTADSVGVNLNASTTAIVCVINGRYISIGAVTARAFTTNVDTYIDVLDNADGTGTIVYTDRKSVV